MAIIFANQDKEFNLLTKTEILIKFFNSGFQFCIFPVSFGVSAGFLL